MEMNSIAGIQFPNIVMNAAGVNCSIEKQLKELNISEAGAIVTKSCTFNAWDGNAGKRWWKDNNISVNSIGHGNKGIAYYMWVLKEIKCLKPQIISIACGPHNTIYTIAYFSLFQQTNQLAELNISCPNTDGKMLGYDFDKLDEFLMYVDNILTKPYGLKLPVYLDLSHFQRMVEIISKHKVAFITCCNTMRGLLLDENLKSRIDPNSGIGGISGPTIKPFALANVKTFAQLFQSKFMDVKIIGCGGIRTAQDVKEYLSNGASFVQIGFGLVNEGLNLFQKIRSKL